MRLNSKLTGGLAWAGLILVLAVPSADILTKPQGDAARTITSDMDAIETATVAPAVKPDVVRVVTAPTVKPVTAAPPKPSFIVEGAPDTAATDPTRIGPETDYQLTTPGASTPARPATQVATAEPQLILDPPAVAPVPRPATARPHTPVDYGPPAPETYVATAPAEQPLFIEPQPSIATEQPLIIDETQIERREAAVDRILEAPVVRSAPAPVIEGDQLEEWDSGSLADYLQRRGLLSGGGEQASRDFDSNGFFLDEGPNEADEPRRRRDDDFFFF
jgi:hypothetical protein